MFDRKAWMKVYMRAYYKANKEKRLAQSRAWDKAHPKTMYKSLLKYIANNPEKRIFWGIKQRCENPNNTSYKNYGGRGIKCTIKNAAEFLATVGKRPSKRHSIDRIDNNADYTPENIRRATPKQQRETKRHNNQWCKGRI